MASRLQNGINRYVTMAATAFGGKQLIDASDTSIGNSARLGLITDSYAQQLALQQQIYQSAKNARGIYSDTVDTVAKLGLLAGDAFNNNAEVVKFSELMQKTFALSGASTMEKQSAMYQLTQAMSAGKLQGDEFRSIMENAPMLAQAIADFTGKSKGELKEMSAEGTITADIIKGAMFSAAYDIEQKYETLPMQFGDAWNGIVSDAQVAFQPVFEMMNNALNSGIGQGMLSGITENIQWLSQLAQEAGTWIQNMVIQAEPALSQLQNTVRGIGSQFLGVNGVVNQVSQNILSVFTAGGVSSLRVYAYTIGNIAVAFSSILNVISPLLPVVTSVYMGFRMYNSINGILQPIVSGIGNIRDGLSTATTAQQSFNSVCNANIYLSIASAIISATTALWGFVSAQKASAKASVLANQLKGLSDVENTLQISNYAKAQGIDNNTASAILKSNYDYDKQIKTLDNLINTDYNVLIDNYAAKDIYKHQLSTGMITRDDLSAIVAKDRAKWEDQRQELIKQRYATQNEYLDNYNQQQNILSKMYEINSEPVGIGNVDTVDIVSEDLKYMRELADQETINQFTSKLLQPSINVTFGEVKETADVDEIISKIVDGITESANNSSDLVHIF